MSQHTFRVLAASCKGFYILWIVVFLILVILSMIGNFMAEPTIYYGIQSALSIFNPFNIGNFIVTVVLLLPAMGAYKLEEYFRSRSSRA
jgi:hypothetical protein